MNLNIPLIRRVKRWILTHPDEYDQTGCTRCIGAVAYYLANNIPHAKWNKSRVIFPGKKGAYGLLGLSKNRLSHLFLLSAFPIGGVWPHPFGSQWEKARTRRERARIAVRRLDSLLKTGR